VDPKLPVRGIDYTVIFARQMTAMREFYGATLGFPLHKDVGSKWVEFRVGSRYQSRSGIRWAIREATSDELIGSCGFNSWSEKMRNATIGYDLKRARWGKGIATEALSEIVRAAFAGLVPCGALHRIQADTIMGNVASERVLTKLRFREEGTRRQAAYLRGAYRDMKCFGLIKPDMDET
jgi:[ribosomal protein S5]-alanine N-acetyltransferase